MAPPIEYAKMTVETPDGVTYIFPNVKLEVQPNIEPGLEYGEPGYFYEKAPDRLKSMSIVGTAFPGKTDLFPNEEYVMTARMKEEEVACKIPELYEDDLRKIADAMSILDDLSRTGVFSCELRVKTDDVDTWVVIGYGEDGAPAILRFEKDNG